MLALWKYFKIIVALNINQYIFIYKFWRKRKMKNAIEFVEKFGFVVAYRIYRHIPVSYKSFNFSHGKLNIFFDEDEGEVRVSDVGKIVKAKEIADACKNKPERSLTPRELIAIKLVESCQ